jgi:ornithine cyclodeaminase/alanine dehydrogenase-like protein (mu-crystallin family)
VRRADLVVTATASTVAVIRNDWISDGTHLIAVGACFPTERELDPALVARASGGGFA